jgi:hypothetical protein
VWSNWHQLDATAMRGLIPREAGIYRLRCRGHAELIYVGISDRLSARLGGLRRACNRPPGHRGHSAAACVAGYENHSEVVEVSWAPVAGMDRRALMGLEVDLIAACRAASARARRASSTVAPRSSGLVHRRVRLPWPALEAIPQAHERRGSPDA